MAQGPPHPQFSSIFWHSALLDSAGSTHVTLRLHFAVGIFTAPLLDRRKTGGGAQNISKQNKRSNTAELDVAISLAIPHFREQSPGTTSKEGTNQSLPPKTWSRFQWIRAMHLEMFPGTPNTIDQWPLTWPDLSTLQNLFGSVLCPNPSGEPPTLQSASHFRFDRVVWGQPFWKLLQHLEPRLRESTVNLCNFHAIVALDKNVSCLTSLQIYMVDDAGFIEKLGVDAGLYEWKDAWMRRCCMSCSSETSKQEYW